MRRVAARGAVAWAALHALVVPACRGSEAPPVSAAASPDEGIDDPAAPYLLPPPEGGDPVEPREEASPDEGVVELDVTRVERSRVPAPRGDAPSRGPVDAPVTIQVFSDFECPFCAGAVPLLRAVEAEFGGRVRVVWHDFPLPRHPHARRAAAAAIEVYRTRGGAAFWRFHDALFQAQRRGLTDAAIDELARREGVDARRYAAAVTTGIHDARIDADIQAGEAAGVDATPAFFVNDYLTVGVMPFPAMRALVERALKDAGR